MNRRTLLSAIGTLPLTPGAVTRVTAPPLPRDETDEWWWGYVKHAIELGGTMYCTDRFLDTAVKRSHLDHTSDTEAKRVIRAAFNDAYDLSDIPAKYR